MTDKPIIRVSLDCANEPGYYEWSEKAHVAGFHVVMMPDFHDTFLTIHPRCIQFRGDWSAWWLDPARLQEFKAYNEGGPKGCADAEAPDSQQRGDTSDTADQTAVRDVGKPTT